MKEHLKGQYGEDAVNHVATGTFLKYWCYPSPKDENGNGKEITDLLILFQDKALIVSVKNYAFKGNYEKYFRLTLKKAVSQISGAERKLFELDGQITFTHPTRGKHEFTPHRYKTVHRLIVNLSTDPQFYPGGLETKKGKVVHVFNWFAFLQVLNELNTISDFFQYLNEREEICQLKQLYLLCGSEEDWLPETGLQFLNYLPDNVEDKNSRPTIMFSGNELDLLAVYLSNVRKFDPVFYNQKTKITFFELDGHWDRYLQRKEVQNKKEEEGASYFWDEVVKREVLYYDDEERIKIATELLALDRFKRRVIGKEFWNFLNRNKDKNVNHTARTYTNLDNCVLSFFMHSDEIHGEIVDEELVLGLMDIAGRGYLEYTKYEFNRIIMIGVNSKLTQFKFLFLEDATPLKGDDLIELQTNLRLLKWFKNMKFHERENKEYPD